MSKSYTVEYFIEKFEAIPEEKWTSGTFVNFKGQCCALGHCGQVSDSVGFPVPTEEGTELSSLIRKLGTNVVLVNDGLGGYGQDNPRARVLAALRDLKLKGVK